VNVLVPHQLDVIIKELAEEKGGQGIKYLKKALTKVKFPWKSLLTYLVLRYLQGNLGTIRSSWWLPVQHVFSLLHTLSENVAVLLPHSVDSRIGTRTFIVFALPPQSETRRDSGHVRES